jgi:tRNA U34 5-carboxymethylaminomethyl modifying enzyme MnmG/GidA
MAKVICCKCNVTQERLVGYSGKSGIVQNVKELINMKTKSERIQEVSDILKNYDLTPKDLTGECLNEAVGKVSAELLSYCQIEELDDLALEEILQECSKLMFHEAV